MNESQRIQLTITSRNFTCHDVAVWFWEQTSDMQVWFLNYLLYFTVNSMGVDGLKQLAFIAESAITHSKEYRALASLAEDIFRGTKEKAATDE